MNYEKICKLVDGIIESEFNNVQEFRETDFSDKDLEQKELNKVSIELMDKLVITLPEETKYLLDEVEAAFINEWINLCRFYFKEGVAAALTNLKFLNNIDSVESYFR
jgi:hypothetical protein